MPLSHVLDLFQHWVLSEMGVSEETRKEVRNSWTGAPIVSRDVPPEESWAPSWWHGDEEASMSGIAAAAQLAASRKA